MITIDRIIVIIKIIYHILIIFLHTNRSLLSMKMHDQISLHHINLPSSEIVRIPFFLVLKALIVEGENPQN